MPQQFQTVLTGGTAESRHAKFGEDSFVQDANAIDIFVVEDNKVVQHAIKNILARVDDFHFVGSAEDGIEAVEKICALRPQFAIVDIGLPGMNGIEVTRKIKAETGGTRVIILTASDVDRDVTDCFAAGADGYIHKEMFAERLETAIRTVRQGAVWLDPALARRILQIAAFAATGDHLKPAQKRKATLTEMEADVLSRVAESNCEGGVCLVEPGFVAKLRQRFPEKKDEQNSDEPAITST